MVGAAAYIRTLAFLLTFLAATLPAARAEETLPPGHVFFSQESISPGEAGPWKQTNTNRAGAATRSFALPVEQMRGTYVLVAADVKAQEVSAKPEAWNGIKVMLKVESASGTDWPQPDLPAGTFDWQRVSRRILIPPKATAVTLVLGLEEVTGTVWFDHVKVSLVRLAQPAPPAPAGQEVFRGHNQPRLRGAMVSPNLSEADLSVLAGQWHANLIRWQLIRSNVPESESDGPSYDQWLEGRLVKTDQVLGWAKQQGVKVVLDLHSPPGGKSSAGGYVAAMGGIFTQPAAQRHFVEVWRKLARRYQGNTTIWGFDLVNEPVDDQTAEGCEDWQELALTAGKAVREIDPERVLIVEPPRWGGPAGWEGFNPIPLARVVYSFHMYEPGAFTHQRVFDHNQRPVAYPGKIGGQSWNREKLILAMQPSLDFARKYRVHLYVGEFSAIRWAPGAEKYLADLTSIFEEQGWDWSYHAFREWQGWSLEHGTDEKNEQPSAQPTARYEVIERWLKQNRPAGEER